jgi:hypothetical protein
MFDVQVLRHRDAAEVPEEALDSISGYYQRVTTTASPMGRLVGLVMVVLLAALVVQAASGDARVWVSAVSIIAAVLAIGLAIGRVFGRAQRLGERRDPPAVKSALARSICRDHLICLAAMASVVAVQLGG